MDTQVTESKSLNHQAITGQNPADGNHKNKYNNKTWNKTSETMTEAQCIHSTFPMRWTNRNWRFGLPFSACESCSSCHVKGAPVFHQPSHPLQTGALTLPGFRHCFGVSSPERKYISGAPENILSVFGGIRVHDFPLLACNVDVVREHSYKWPASSKKVVWSLEVGTTNRSRTT